MPSPPSYLRLDVEDDDPFASTSSLLATYDADHPPHRRRYSFVPSEAGPASPTLSASSLPFATPPRPPKSPRRYSNASLPSLESQDPYAFSVLDRQSLFASSRPSLDTLIRSEKESLLREDTDKMPAPVHDRGETGQTSIIETKRRWLLPTAMIVLFAVLALSLGLGLGLGLPDKDRHGSSAADAASAGDDEKPVLGSTTFATDRPQPTASAKPEAPNATYHEGAAGSRIKMADGTEFTYTNDFGGDWAYDTEHPYRVSGKAQSWSPRINETWTYGTDQMRGVNFGGWLVTEPFIVPSLYEAHLPDDPSITDEWSLCAALGPRAADVMEEHYKTFITEEDFAAVAAAGLNWLRIPLGYWAVEALPGDPYVGGVSWTYFLKAVVWARKYGLRILLDVHALPGSQNGWNHSGRGNGTINFMQGAGGIVNAQRSLNYLRTLAQWVSQDGIRDVVPVLGLVNEVRAQGYTGQEQIGAFYTQAYNVIREATGYGAGNGPFLAVHEGFTGPQQWTGFMAGADRMVMDFHPYKAFNGMGDWAKPWAEQLADVCAWGGMTSASAAGFGLTVGGEWSLATNDCGKWLNSIGGDAAFGDCSAHDDWRTFDATMKGHLRDQFMGTADALQNYFFWTWKIANSTVEGYATSPKWHYRLGWEQGWIPKDPRDADGFCASRGLSASHFAGTYAPNQLGADPSPVPQAVQFPPAVISDAAGGVLPTLTATGTPITLVMPTEYRSVSGAGNGWANPSDTAPAYTEVAGCGYSGQYDTNGYWDGSCAAGRAVAAPVATATAVPVVPEVPAVVVPAVVVDPAAVVPVVAPAAAETTAPAVVPAVEPAVVPETGVVI